MDRNDDPTAASACVNQPDAVIAEPAARLEICPPRRLTRRAELVANLPYAAMVLLGAAVFPVGLKANPWGWISAGAYGAYGLAGALWVMVFICPYCDFHGTRLCPCGYGRIAARLRPKKDGSSFARQFRRHIPVIVPLWVIPVIAGGIVLLREFTWTLLGLVLAFAVNSFAILPLVSTKYSCARCPQKETCPWTGCRRSGK